MRVLVSMAGGWIAGFGIALIIYGLSLKRLAKRGRS